MCEICPICLQNEVDILTECKHSFCVQCLCRVKNCPLCRKLLNKSKICNGINKIEGELSNELIFLMNENSFVEREETNPIITFEWTNVWRNNSLDSFE
jgi:hypothetical protein